MVKRFEERLHDLAAKLLAIYADVSLAPCPWCKEAGGLTAGIEAGHVRVRCVTPVPRPHNDDDASGECGYELIVYATNVSLLPKPVFAPVSPIRRRKVVK